MMTVGCMAPALWSQLRQRWCHWKRRPRCRSTLSSKCRQWCRWNQRVKAKEQKARNDKKSFVFRLWFGVVYLNVTMLFALPQMALACFSLGGFLLQLGRGEGSSMFEFFSTVLVCQMGVPQCRAGSRRSGLSECHLRWDAIWCLPFPVYIFYVDFIFKLFGVCAGVIWCSFASHVLWNPVGLHSLFHVQWSTYRGGGFLPWKWNMGPAVVVPFQMQPFFHLHDYGKKGKWYGS